MVQKCKLCCRENSIGERILFLRGYKKYCGCYTPAVYLFFTDILKDTITPYNVSNLHTYLFSKGHVRQTAWLVKASDG